LQGVEESCYCVIKADKKKMADFGMAWIPKSYQKMTSDKQIEEQDVWDKDEDVIVDYVKSLVPEKPEKALRFSYVKGPHWWLQMVIPTNVIDDDDLDLWAKCYRSQDELIAIWNYGVRWENWKQIKGDRGTPSINPQVA
jgi:hypothetical protein